MIKYGLIKKCIEQTYRCSILVVSERTTDNRTKVMVSARTRNTTDDPADTAETILHSETRIHEVRTYAIFCALEAVAQHLKKDWLSAQFDSNGQLDLFGYTHYRNY